MAKPRFYKLDKNKQEKILRIASQEFAKTGYRETSYNKIIEKLEISKGAMYYYFGGKSDIYKEIMTTNLTDFIEGFWSEEPDFTNIDTFWASMAENSRKGLEFMLKNPEGTALYKDMLLCKFDPGVASPTKEFLALFDQFSTKIFARGQEENIIRTDLPLDLLVKMYSGLGEAIDEWFFKNSMETSSPAEIEQMMVTIIGVFRKVFSNG